MKRHETQYWCAVDFSFCVCSHCRITNRFLVIVAINAPALGPGRSFEKRKYKNSFNDLHQFAAAYHTYLPMETSKRNG